MTAQQQFDRLQAAFPGKYVSIKAEINGGGGVTRYNQFHAYVEHVTLEQGRSLTGVVDKAIAYATAAAAEPQDAAEAIDQIGGAQ